MCGAPKQDPALGEAAKMNAAIAQDQLAFGKEQWAYEKAQWDKYAPMYEQLMQASVDDAKLGRERSQFAWDRYLSKGVPIENRIYSDAQTYDSAAETAKREGLAAGTVQSQIDAQREDTTRQLAAMGVSAERTGQQITTDANTAALAKASAINKERSDTKLTGMALRESAAALASGLPSMSMAQTQQAQAAGGAAMGAAGAGQAFRGNAANMRNSAVSSAVTANNSAIAGFNAQFANRMATYGTNMNNIGTIAGTAMSTAAMYF